MDAIFTSQFSLNPLDGLICFHKGGGSPPPPAPPAPPPTANAVEVRQQERDLRRSRLRRRGMEDTILAGDALGDDQSRKTLLGG